LGGRERERERERQTGGGREREREERVHLERNISSSKRRTHHLRAPYVPLYTHFHTIYLHPAAAVARRREEEERRRTGVLQVKMCTPLHSLQPRGGSVV
jgi:hypothetical protein